MACSVFHQRFITFFPLNIQPPKFKLPSHPHPTFCFTLRFRGQGFLCYSVKQTCYILVALLPFLGVTFSCIDQVHQDCWPPAKGDFQFPSASEWPMLEDTRHVQLHHQATDTETAGTRRIESHKNLPLYAEGMKPLSKDMPWLDFSTLSVWG